ncbi:ArsR/SmtB family transcription factor [Pseudaestuariivita sp.]|uniref:ArsR/SmtB family transcription factor n=1 Tax=Pseudaestuariivita sp. TaxID=2211669 RepID=UPI004058D7E6
MKTDLILKALGHPQRRLLLDLLREPRAAFPPPLPEHEDLPGVCSGYLPERLGLAAPTVSQYLALLEQAELITRTRHGRWVFVARDEDGIARALQALTDEIGAMNG